MKTHGGKRPGSGRKKELPEGAKPYSFKLTKDEQVQVREFIENLRSEFKMINKIKKAAIEYSKKAEYVDNLEALGATGLIDKAKAKEMQAYENMMSLISNSNIDINEIVKNIHHLPTEKIIMNGPRW